MLLESCRLGLNFVKKNILDLTVKISFSTNKLEKVKLLFFDGIQVSFQEAAVQDDS